MIGSCAGVWHLIDTGDSDPLDWPLARLFRKSTAVLKALMKKEDFEGFWARIHVPPSLDELPTSGPWSREAIARDALAAGQQLGAVL